MTHVSNTDRKITKNDLILNSTSMASLGARIPAPLARYHTIVICKGNHITPPTTTKMKAQTEENFQKTIMDEIVNLKKPPERK